MDWKQFHLLKAKIGVKTFPNLLHGMFIFEMLRVQGNNKSKDKTRESNNLENTGLKILKEKNIFYCRISRSLGYNNWNLTTLESEEHLQNK